MDVKERRKIRAELEFLTSQLSPDTAPAYQPPSMIGNLIPLYTGHGAKSNFSPQITHDAEAKNPSTKKHFQIDHKTRQVRYGEYFVTVYIYI